jgi:Flp pilus assembly protein TadG
MSICSTRLRQVVRPRRGQSIVEAAFILPIFLLVVFATLDLGRIVFLKSELENAAREGARVGLVSQPFSESAVRDRIRAQPGLASATVSASCSASCVYGSTVTVTATLPVSVVVGLVPALPSLTIRASASVRVE